MRILIIRTAFQIHIRMTKSRRMRWVGHVSERSVCIGLAVKPERRRYLNIDGRIILKCISGVGC
jgi:hypothetical protein